MKITWRDRAAFLVLGLFLTGVVVASPAAYVYTPNVVQGEREIDIKSGAASPVGSNSAQAASVAFGYGATNYWFTEVYVKQERNGNQSSTLAEWDNKFQLTETGEYPVDVGLVTELEVPLSSQTPWEIRFGPLFQTEFGKVQVNTNFLFTRAFGMADETGVPFVTNFSYQWQVKYRWQAVFEFGMQGMGGMGKWNNWSPQAKQTHRFGPAVFGKFALGNRRAINYNAAWLLGASNAAPANTVRLQVEYEF